jgi:hypothetical protein
MLWFPLFNGIPAGRPRSAEYRLAATQNSRAAGGDLRQRLATIQNPLRVARIRSQPTNGAAWLRAFILRWSKAT